MNKKNYIKPMIDFDSFEMQGTFAASCAVSPNHDSAGGCAVILGGIPVFTETAQGCKFKVSDGYNNICYYVPSADNTVFGS